MNPWPVGFSTGCFHHRRIFDILAEIRDAGFREIEVCSFPPHLDYHNVADVRRAGDMMRDFDLHPFSFHAPFADRIDITSSDHALREEAVQELFTACEAAALMHCKHVVLHPGPERAGRPNDDEFLQCMRHAAESLNRVADHCCELGVHLLLENMLPHLLFGRVSDMLYLLGEIKTCDVGACLDTGHAHLAQELGMVIPKLSGHLKMVHANDNRGERDAHLPPGEGAIDWRWVIGELHRSGFQGVLVLELSAGAHEPPADVLARAARSRRFLEDLCLEEQRSTAAVH